MAKRKPPSRARVPSLAQAFDLAIASGFNEGLRLAVLFREMRDRDLVDLLAAHRLDRGAAVAEGTRQFCDLRIEAIEMELYARRKAKR
jgi:hypothetical protein